MTDTNRARIDTLLAEAHMAGMMTGTVDREKFNRAWIEILSLVRDGADLSPAPKAETLQPLPTLPHAITPQTLTEGYERLAGLRRELDRLRLKPRLERSVVDDDQLAALPGDISRLMNEIKNAEQMGASRG